ncbi:serine proteinase [Pilatotrama ljubarskyi]|nr:serine proteinase [Pilatotrama ljubarskyi]
MSSDGTPQKLVEVHIVEGRKKENSYIVHLKGHVDKARYLRELTGRSGPKASVEFDYPSGFANAFAGTFDEETLNAIRASSEVESIHEDAIGSIFVETVQNDASWNLNRISQRPKLPFKYTYDGAATGNNVDIYIVDTGVDVSHVDFGGRASWGWVRPGLPQADDHGHGTQVASVAAGTHLGVAKEANIIAVKTHDRLGDAPTSVVFDAMGWIWSRVQTTQRPSIVNMSFGYSPADANIDMGVQELTNYGIHVCAAAGNDARDASNISPARCATAITVGASNVDDARHTTSNYGPVLNVFAPGSCIKVATIGSQTAVTYADGTSFASPHVAGIVAYFISLGGNVWPAEMMNRITQLALKGVLTDIRKWSKRAQVASYSLKGTNAVLFVDFFLAAAGTPNLLANNGN